MDYDGIYFGMCNNQYDIWVCSNDACTENDENDMTNHRIFGYCSYSMFRQTQKKGLIIKMWGVSQRTWEQTQVMEPEIFRKICIKIM